MISFNKLEVRNFMSFGNALTQIELDDRGHVIVRGENRDSQDPSQGRNGVGKSTSFHAICYAMYGDTFVPIKAGDYVNITNKKNMVVTLHFSVDGDEYEISRGRKPDVKEIVKNGQPFSTATAKGFDEAIEEIVGMDLNTFTTAFMLTTKTTQFLHMKPAAQRDFMERLLKLDVLTTRAEALKTNRKEVKADIKVAEAERDAHNRNQDVIRGDLIVAKGEAAEWDDEHMRLTLEQEQRIASINEIDFLAEAEAIEAMDEYNELIAKMDAKIAEVTQAIQAVETRVDTIEQSVRTEKKYLERIEGNINKLKAQQVSMGTDREATIQEYKNRIANFESLDLDAMRAELQLYADNVAQKADVQKELDENERKISEARQEYTKQQSLIATLVAEQKTISQQRNADEKGIETEQQKMTKLLAQLEHIRSGECPFCSQEYFSKDKEKELELEIEVCDQSIFHYRENIEGWDIDYKANADRQTDENNKLTKLKQAGIELLSISDEIETRRDAIECVKPEFTESELVQYENEYKTAVELLANAQSEDFVDPFQEQIDDLEKDYTEKESYIQELEDKAEQTASEASPLLQQEDELVHDRDHIQKPQEPQWEATQLLKLEMELEQLEKGLSDLQKQVNPHTARIKQLESRIKEYDQGIIDYLVEKDEHYDILIKLLTSNKSYVRKSVLDQYVPFLNAKVNEYLAELDSQQRLLINSDLTIDVEYLGKTISVGNLSTGEQLRAQLSLALAFGDLYESNGVRFNMLFIDELFDAGSDSLFLYRAFKLIKQKYENSYVISHKDELVAKADCVMNVIKEHGFSDVEFLSN